VRANKREQWRKDSSSMEGETRGRREEKQVRSEEHGFADPGHLHFGSMGGVWVNCVVLTLYIAIYT